MTAAVRFCQNRRMETTEHIAALRREGELLAATVARTDLDAPVPTCPEWCVRELVQHLGDVHRWAATYVREGHTEHLAMEDEAPIFGTWPQDSGLVDWFREGHAALVRTLETAAPDLACWSFLPNIRSPLAFWARRQAHETAIHRADATRASGAITPFPAAFAADGIDELLFGFFARPRKRLRADPPCTLHLHADDADGTDDGSDWLVEFGPERVVASRDSQDGDCSVHGSASDLYLLLWNRRTLDGLDVHGDRSILDFWRERATVRWS